MEHNIPLKELTYAKIHVNLDAMLSETAHILDRLDNLLIEQGKEHLLELEFDNGRLKQSKDFRPDVPLIFRW